MKTRVASLLGLGVAVMAVLQLQAAVMLPPGGSVGPLGNTPVGGTLVASMNSPFADAGGAFSGTLDTRVWANDPNNIFGPGGLTFQYTLNNSANSRDALERLTIVGWSTSLSIAVDNATSLGTPAYSATRSAGLGDTVGFSWLLLSGFGAVGPGGFGTVIVQTPLSGWTSSTASIIDGGIGTAGTLTPVPEPSVLALSLGFGLLLVRLRMWR